MTRTQFAVKCCAAAEAAAESNIFAWFPLKKQFFFFIILFDISGYTNFIRMHKVSLLHAEKIIGELMESFLDAVEAPVIAHEILGDAISLFALDDGSSNLADDWWLYA